MAHCTVATISQGMVGWNVGHADPVIGRASARPVGFAPYASPYETLKT